MKRCEAKSVYIYFFYNNTPCDLKPEDRVLALVRLDVRHLSVNARKVASSSHVVVTATQLAQRLHKRYIEYAILMCKLTNVG